jgi:hypothetical protein
MCELTCANRFDSLPVEDCQQIAEGCICDSGYYLSQLVDSLPLVMSQIYWHMSIHTLCGYSITCCFYHTLKTQIFDCF